MAKFRICQAQSTIGPKSTDKDPAVRTFYMVRLVTLLRIVVKRGQRGNIVSAASL